MARVWILSYVNSLFKFEQKSRVGLNYTGNGYLGYSFALSADKFHISPIVNNSIWKRQVAYPRQTCQIRAPDRLWRDGGNIARQFQAETNNLVVVCPS